jgi:hypothetical protein
MGRAWIICKKLFSLSLIFNSLLTITCCAGIIAGFLLWYPDWLPFYPFLFSGSVFWLVIAAAAINIFPSALLGRKLHTGRFLFHHYFYGFLVLACAALFVVFFSPVPLFSIFIVNDTSALVNVGRFFLIGGLTLLLDDLPDVSKKLESGLNSMKSWAYRVRKAIVALEVATGVFSLYLSFAVLAAMTQVPEWVTVANIILFFTSLITGITSLVFVKRNAWNHIMDEQEKKH